MAFPCKRCLKIPEEGAGAMQRCGRCRAVYYCSRECQMGDWGGGGHKELCKIAAAALSSREIDASQGMTPDYAKEYARRHPLKRSHIKQLEDLRRLCSQYELIKGMINLREQEQIGEDFMFFKRFQAPRRWTVEEARRMLGKHRAGELSIGQMLEPTTERNTSAETIKDHPPMRISYRRGFTYVAVGCVDLSQLLLGEIPDEFGDDSDDAGPITFVGIDCGADQVNRAELVLEMLRDDSVTARDVMQVWFSTQLDLSAKRALMRVGRRLKREVVSGWAGNSLKISDGLQDMGAPLENELLTLNCLSREADRVDYAEYVFSGKVFVKDDQPAVCANPTRRRGTCGNRESVFDICSLDMFESCKNNGVSLFQALDNYFEERTVKLKRLISRGNLVVKLHRQRVTMRANDPAEGLIRDLGPVAAIDWSNVPDYLDPSAFVEFATRCGGPDTVHTVHSAGWTNLVYGASIVDYAFSKDFDLDQMLETARQLLDAEWRMDISKRPHLSSFLAEDCGVRHFTIEAVDSALSLHYRQRFLSHFYASSSSSSNESVVVAMDARKSVNELGGNRSASNAVDFAFVAANAGDCDHDRLLSAVIVNYGEANFVTVQAEDS